MSIVKNGKYYFYDFVHEGKRYRRSCRTTDRKLAEQIEISVKNDIINKNHSLPTDKNKRLLFQAVWEIYLKNNGNTEKDVERKIIAARHFLHFSRIKPYQISFRSTLKITSLKESSK